MNQQAVNHKIIERVQLSGGVYDADGKFTRDVKTGQECFEETWSDDFDLEVPGVEEESLLYPGQTTTYPPRYFKRIGVWTETYSLRHDEQ